jgi:hypothetical protein
MRTRTCRGLSAAVIALACVASSAHATGWVAPVEGCEIVTAFGAVYSGKTHRGVDLAASAGAEVSTPAAGRVTFAGRVPADGGGTCGAVTVEIADGLRVSLLPLGDVFVSAGEGLSAGEVVGTIAAAGDDSHAMPHLHLGLRRGDTYLDPTGLLPVVSGAPAAPEPPGPPDIVPDPDVPPGVEPLTSSVPAVSGHVEPAGSPSADAVDGCASGSGEPVAAPVAPAAASGPVGASQSVPSSPDVSGRGAPGVQPATTGGAAVSGPAGGPVPAEATGAARGLSPESVLRATARHPVPEDAGIPPESTLVHTHAFGRSAWRMRVSPVSLPGAASGALTLAVGLAAVAAMRGTRHAREQHAAVR